MAICSTIKYFTQMSNTTDSKTVFHKTTLIKCQSGHYLAFFNHRDDILANGENRVEALENLDTLYEMVMEYEQSELKQAEQPKRIEVKALDYKGWSVNDDGRTERLRYEFSSTDFIPDSKVDGLKKAIESFLNNEVPDIPTLSRQGISYRDVLKAHGNGVDIFNKEALDEWMKGKPKDTIQDKGDWEIVSFESIHGEVLKLENFKYRSETSSISDIDFLLKHYSIRSVRRLSDNVVFSVGDKIGWGIHKSYETTLLGFEIQDGRLKFNDSERPEHCGWVDFLNAVDLHKKLPPKEEVKPKQMWHKVVGVHDEQVLCVSHGCVEYNPLNKEHSLK